jgi:hypothetical protein
VFQEDGVLYIWDGVSESFSESVNLDAIIRAVIQIANETYII